MSTSIDVGVLIDSESSFVAHAHGTDTPIGVVRFDIYGRHTIQSCDPDAFRALAEAATHAADKLAALIAAQVQEPLPEAVS